MGEKLAQQGADGHGAAVLWYARHAGLHEEKEQARVVRGAVAVRHAAGDPDRVWGGTIRLGAVL